MPKYNDIRDVSQIALQVYKYEKMDLDALFEVLTQKYQSYAKSGIRDIKRAYVLGKEFHATQKRRSGAPYFTHPLIVAILLTDHQPDKNTIVAALLHDLIEDTQATYKDLEVFDKEVTQMIEGLTKINQSQDQFDSNSKKHLKTKLETIRKILRYGEHDIRVLAIKTFDRFHNILTLFWKKDPEWAKRYIRQTLDIYLPIAKRIGLREVHHSMIHHAQYYLDQDIFFEKSEQEKVYEKQTKKIERTIKNYLTKKTNFSIQKVQSKKNKKSFQLDLEEISLEDAYYVQVVVPHKQDCFDLLRYLNSPKDMTIIPIGVVRDYISKPKLSKYQALHLDVIVEGKQKIQLHILSERMLKVAEKPLSLTKIKEIYPTILFHDFDLIDEATTSNSDKFISAVMSHVFAKKMQIHNPEKKEVYVPYDFSALDAAMYLFPRKIRYIDKIYVNQQEVSLGHLLNSNDIVEVFFSKKAKIEPDWTQSLESDVSKFRLQKALRKEGASHTIRQGKRILQEHFDILRLGDIRGPIERDAQKLLGHTPDELYQMVGQGSLMPIEVMEGLGKTKRNKWLLFLEEKWIQLSTGRKDTNFVPSNIQFLFKSTAGAKKLSNILQSACETHDVSVQGIQLQKNKQIYHGKVHLSAINKKNLYEAFLQITNDENIFLKHIILKKRFKLKILGLVAILLIGWGSFLWISGSLATRGYHESFIYLGATLPILANIFIYKFCMYYFTSWRHNKTLLFLLCLFNIVAIGVISYVIIQANQDTYNLSLFFPALIGTLSTIFTLILFYRNRLYTEKNTSLPSKQATKQQLITGYLIRIGAVIIWGVLPVYIKYLTPSHVDASIKLIFLTFGMVLTGAIIFFLQSFFSNKKPSLAIPINRYFVFTSLGLVGVFYLYILSLSFTTSTNLILLSNFAPVFTLVVASFFWRKELPYLRSFKNIQAIFFVFMIGGIGSMLLFFNDMRHGAAGNITGNLIALSVMLVDILYIIGQIRYVRYLKKSFTGYIASILGLGGCILSLPLIATHVHDIFQLSTNEVLLLLGIGAINALGLVLNLEAFKRIDGFIAHLLFNISIVIAFCLEAFVLGEILPTGLLIASMVLIIGSAIGAEYINIRSKRTK